MGRAAGHDPAGLPVLFATGIFIADRVNKMPLVLAFLGGYYLLFTLTAFVGDPGGVAEIFRTPDLHAVLFFAFFILTDPPTSPVKYPRSARVRRDRRGSELRGLRLVGAAYYLLAGVLVGNVWEAWRRVRRHPYSPSRQSAVGQWLRRNSGPSLSIANIRRAAARQREWS